ncbi:Alpha/beta hydrolase family protein [Sinosporangium album]|uniref:Alpha/beta hydrolase family protein n=1 Tax=Sinosporangium album TaxID=504805 RepID=A0A1G8GGU4_9ACTN|nr:alpha/beta fold hydrolase [Sinosporangium album]SDH93585.1 Alpha/beta hydrolase family protein [Sinosporangium album]
MKRRPRLSTAAALATAAALLLVSCGGGGPRRVTPDAALDAQCDSVPSGAERVVVEAIDGVRLGAAVIGSPSADVVVVVVHGGTQTLCDWLEEAARLAKTHGVRVIVPDRRGFGSSEGRAEAHLYPSDTVDAAFLMSHKWAVTTRYRSGRDKPAFVMLGASYGAPIALMAAMPESLQERLGPTDALMPLRMPPSCAAVVISPALSIEEPAGRLRPVNMSSFAPSLWIAAEEGSPAIAANARTLATRMPAKEKPHLLLVPGTLHGSGLLNDDARVRELVDRAVTSCAPKHRGDTLRGSQES